MSKIHYFKIQIMSYQKRKSAVSLISNLLIFAIYYGFMLRMERALPETANETAHFLCSAILLLLPVLILGKLVIHIIFTIINSMLRNEREPAFTDELDKLILLKSIRNFCFVFAAGFFAAIGTVASGADSSVLFHLFLFTIILAGITIDLSQLYFYRKGAQ